MTGGSPPSRTDRRREPRKAGAAESSSSSRGSESGGTGAATVAVESRNGELIARGKPRPTAEQQLSVEEEERGAEAVAAVAAALRTGGAAAPPEQHQHQHQQSPAAAAAYSSSMPPLPGSMGFATPSAAARPTMAPFSVSDTSDFEEAMSPGEGPPRRRGSRGSETGLWASSVAEGDEDEEGGVEGVAEVAAAADGDAGRQQGATGAAGVTIPLSPTSGGESDTFFDAEEPSAAATTAEGGDKAGGAGKGGSDGASRERPGAVSLENGGVAGAGAEAGAGEEVRGEDDEDSLSGDGVGCKRARGLVAPNSGGGGGVDGGVGNGNEREQAGSTETSELGAAGASVADADSEWSCSKVRHVDKRGVRQRLKRAGVMALALAFGDKGWELNNRAVRVPGRRVKSDSFGQMEDMRETDSSAPPCTRICLFCAPRCRFATPATSETRFFFILFFDGTI